MKLDAITLTGATFSIAESKKFSIYEYLWSDTNAVEESGAGVTTIQVSGLLTSAAARDALQAACQAGGAKKLYFTSAIGATADDRYYNVYTKPLQLAPDNKSATVYTYSLECIAADTTVYLTSDDSAVW